MGMMQDFKSKLVKCVANRAKKNPSKDMLVIDVSECQIVINGELGKGFMASLHSMDLTGTYTGEPVKAKKEAVQNVCKLALNAEFPGEQPPMVKVINPNTVVKVPKVERPKTTLPGSSMANELKGKVNHAIAILLGRSVTSKDVIYTTQHTANGTYVSTLMVPEYGPEGYQGHPAPDKKQAEQSAAANVLATLADVIAVAEAQHQIRKEQKKLEHEAKKAAGALV